jgi:tight adherence protein B
MFDATIPTVVTAVALTESLHELTILLCVGASVALFVYNGILMFATGWQSYEQRYLEDAERTLDSIYLTIPPQHVVYLSIACWAVATFLWAWLFGNLWVGALFGLTGLALPKLLLWWLKKRRNEKFDRQLVEALTNMGNSLKAGFSLAQAFELLAQEMENPMRQEIGLVVREMQVGVTMDDALAHLYERMPSKDLDLVITSISISREVGGDLTEIFDNIAHTIRERHRIEGKIKALSAQGKLQGFVICSIPPLMAVALSYIAPPLIRPLYTTAIGWGVMALIVLLMSAGIYSIYRIVAIEV